MPAALPPAPLQLILALLVRKARWEVLDLQEQWDEFPLASPKKGLPLTIRAI